MLRFTAQDPDGARLEASLQSATVANWARAFRGAVIDNAYRAPSNPIRLRSLDADRIAQAPVASMLGIATGSNGVGLNLRVEPATGAGASEAVSVGTSVATGGAAGAAGVGGAGGLKEGAAGGAKSDGTAPLKAPRLVGQDEQFTYVFEPVDPAWTPPVAGASGVGAGGAAGAAGVGAAGMTRALPPFPGTVGAYVLSDDGKWAPLPRNNGTVNRSLVQKLNGFFGGLKQAEAKIAGQSMPASADVTANVLFDGTTTVPAVSGQEVILVYAGPLAISPSILAKYPELALEPIVELAPLWTLDSGVRSAPMVSPVKGFFGFGAMRIPATASAPALGITLVRCTVGLPSRHYAFAAGDYLYELAVE